MASLLETFGILFTSNEKDAVAATTRVEKAQDKLEQRIKETDKYTRELDSSFNALMASAKGALVSVLSAGALFAGFTAITRQTDEVGKFSQVLGLNVEQLSAWSEAATRFGGSAEAFRGSVGAMTSQLSNFVLVGDSAIVETLARIGISAYDASGRLKTAFDLLPEIADVFQQLDQTKAVAFGQRLGLDQGTILLLQQGRREVEALVSRQKQLGVTTQEDAKRAAEFTFAWNDFTQIIRDTVQEIGLVVIPIVTRLFDAIKPFIDYVTNHKTLVEGFFIAIGIAVAALSAPFLTVIGVITALGAAFALVYEDITAFINGQDSLIGKIVGRWPVLITVFESIKQVLLSLFPFLNLFAEGPAKIIDNLIAQFEQLKTVITSVWGALKNFTSGFATAIASPENLAKALGFDLQRFSAPSAETQNDIAVGQGALDQATNSPLAPQSTSTIMGNVNNANRTTSVSVGNVNVDARGGDSRDIAENVGAALSEQMKQAVNEFDDGVEI